MSRMPSPMDQLKVRIAFTPATMRKRCGACVSVITPEQTCIVYAPFCQKHGLKTTPNALCKDFSPREGFCPAKDPC